MAEVFAADTALGFGTELRMLLRGPQIRADYPLSQCRACGPTAKSLSVTADIQYHGLFAFAVAYFACIGLAAEWMGTTPYRQLNSLAAFDLARFNQKNF